MYQYHIFAEENHTNIATSFWWVEGVIKCAAPSKRMHMAGLRKNSVRNGYGSLHRGKD